MKHDECAATGQRLNACVVCCVVVTGSSPKQGVVEQMCSECTSDKPCSAQDGHPDLARRVSPMVVTHGDKLIPNPEVSKSVDSTSVSLCRIKTSVYRRMLVYRSWHGACVPGVLREDTHSRYQVHLRCLFSTIGISRVGIQCRLYWWSEIENTN